MTLDDPLLQIRGLKIGFPTLDGMVMASDTVDLTIRAGETLALLGETGSGKTVLGMAIPRLLQPNTRIEGEILFRGRDLLSVSEREMEKIRGEEIAVVLQNSGTSLNPVLRVGDQIAEAIMLHCTLDKTDADAAALHLLRAAQISDPTSTARAYPHRLSGGMQERVLIALALACSPSFLIADEQTRGLDPVTKREILGLFSEINQNRSVLFITHDIDAAATIASRVAVMYAGEIVELGPVDAVLTAPAHPYTRGLLASLPERGMRPIPGSAPSSLHLPTGCRFSPRCSSKGRRCEREHPGLIEIGSGQYARCLVYYDRGS